jgi:glycerol-3-phosphate dehydrogenase
MYDVVIIGAGITGSMLAMELSRYQLKTAVVDKENDVADEATMANSAIIHAGYDPLDGTLKAKLNVAGSRRYEKICQDLHCLYQKCGAFIAATTPEEEATQDQLIRQATERGIPFAVLSGDEARAQEPNLSDQVSRVLSFPTTAVVYPWQIAIACMQVAVGNGAELHLNTEVTAIERIAGGYRVITPAASFETRLVVNAAGIAADKICGMVSANPGFTMKPKKGEYFVIDSNVRDYTHHVIYPVPGKKGKGVLCVPTVYGNYLLGPNSEYIDPEEEERGNTQSGLDYVRANIGKIMKNVPLNHVIRTFAGLRPSSSSADFIINEAEDAPGFINAASIESPGLASAPGIADYIIEQFISRHLPLAVNPAARMEREKPVVMSELSPAEREQKIKENPLYGRIICRCEQISEGEIVDCIHAPVGARSVKGVKKRVRPGMGRCQGGFCEPRVLAILARELEESMLDVVLDSKKSRILESENR